MYECMYVPVRAYLRPSARFLGAEPPARASLEAIRRQCYRWCGSAGWCFQNTEHTGSGLAAGVLRLFHKTRKIICLSVLRRDDSTTVLGIV